MSILTPEQGISLPALDPEIEAMLAAGVQWGHRRSKRHPAMAPYVWGVRSNVEVIDLLKTKEKLALALEFLRGAGREKKVILFVGTRPPLRDLVRSRAHELGHPYAVQRWIGGTLTNFRVVRQRVEALEALEQELAGSDLEKYTKRERAEKEKESERLRANFDGLRRLSRLPDALVIVDLSHDTTALREAKRTGIPVVALTDTNTDPRSVAYPIPANDNARPAVAYMLDRIADAIREGEGQAAAAEAAPDTGA